MPTSLSAFCLSPYPTMSTRALTYFNYLAQHIPQTPTFITHTAAPYRSLPYPHIIILHTDIPLSCSTIRYPPYRIPNTLTLHTWTQLSLQIAPTIPTSSTNYHMKLETELVGRIRLFSSVRYCILPNAVWCGAVHTFSHTLNDCRFGVPPVIYPDPDLMFIILI